MYAKKNNSRMPRHSCIIGNATFYIQKKWLVHTNHFLYKYIPSKLHIRNFLTSLPIHLTWLCPRPISNSQLHVLPHFHLCPINLVVFKGVYSFRMGYLILRGASRLDAFSVYPVPAWLLCYAPGGTTDQPAASPSRSSRTKDSSSQISYAHAG